MRVSGGSGPPVLNIYIEKTLEILKVYEKRCLELLAVEEEIKLFHLAASSAFYLFCFFRVLSYVVSTGTDLLASSFTLVYLHNGIKRSDYN